MREAGGGAGELGEGLARLDGHVNLIVHHDGLGHIRGCREGLALPARALDQHEEHRDARVGRLAELEAAPRRLEVKRREEGDEGGRVTHGKLERRQLDQVVAVDERAVSEVGELVVHARDDVLRLGALVTQEGIETDRAAGGARRGDGHLGRDEVLHLGGRAEALAQLLDEGGEVGRLVLDGDRDAEEHGSSLARAQLPLGLRHVSERREGLARPVRAVDAHENDLDADLDRLAELRAAHLVDKIIGAQENDHLLAIGDGLEATLADGVVLAELRGDHLVKFGREGRVEGHAHIICQLL